MSFKFETTTIYQENEITLTEYHYPDAPFLDNIEYEDSLICFSADKMRLAMLSGKEIADKDGKINMSEVTSEELISTILDISKMNKKIYLAAVEEGNIVKATIFCDKRDMTKMFYKLLISNNFAYDKIYEYCLYAYTSIEDSYGYDILSQGMQYCIDNDTTIKKQIEKTLKPYLKNNKIIAYRGTNKNNRQEDGISYSLDIKVAEFFAKRWKSDGQIRKYEIELDDILAFIDNGEDEIVSKKAKLIKEE